jgi:alkanesulfonate monooxygenase SsuD/methylene tetrahydromethanopterin reductase-like flavin-dependent oxidoreductase (luciferase family)
MKKIGFLSFGHWTAASDSQARSAADVLLQSIDLAVAAEDLGADGAYFRVHHFARQLAPRSRCWRRPGPRLISSSWARR